MIPRLFASLSTLLLPGVLLAHETAGAPHLHPHGTEWLPLLLAALVLGGCAVYFVQRLTR